MALLAGTCYDPGTAVSKSGGTRTVMTAFDTTNLRLTFTAPSNGIVMVRIRCVVQAVGATYPTILLGVLDGSTVKGRVSPVGCLPGTAAANTRPTMEALFTVGGLTPSSSYTWDAAYAVEVLLSSSNIKYGGPDKRLEVMHGVGLSMKYMIHQQSLHKHYMTQVQQSLNLLVHF